MSSPTKCMKCGAHVEVWHNVMLCDPCLGKEIKSVDLAKAHVRLGENNLDGFQSAGVMSAKDLDAIWDAS